MCTNQFIEKLIQNLEKPDFIPQKPKHSFFLKNKNICFPCTECKSKTTQFEPCLVLQLLLIFRLKF